MSGTSRSVVTRFEAKIDGYLAGVAKMSASTEKFAKNATDSAGKHKAQWDKVGNGMLVTGAVIAAGVGLAIKSFADFDKEMSNVQAVSGASAKEMAGLKTAAIDAGRATKFSAAEAATAEAELAKAGVSTADIMGGALTGSLNLAAAGNIGLAKSAEISAQAMNIFNLRGSDVGHIADVLTAGANKSAAGVDDLGLALQQGGLVAKQTGLTLEDTVGTLSAFADNALMSSDAGTSLKTMLQRLNPTSKQASETMDALGLSAYDSQGKFVGITAYAGKLQKALGGLTAEQRNSTLQILFGSDAVRGANILYEQGATGMAKYIAQVNDQGAASRMAAIQMNNLSGDIEQLKGSLETALIQSGSGANNVLRDMVQLVTGAVNAFTEMPSALQSGALGFAAVSAAALITAGGVIKTVTALASAKKALEEIGLASKLAAAAGPAGAALAVLTVAVGLFAKSQMDAKAKADDLRNSLDQQTGAITDNTRAIVAKRLQEAGVFDDAKALGLSLKDVTDAALGQGDALKNLRDRQAEASRSALNLNLQQQLAAPVFGAAGDSFTKLGAATDVASTATDSQRDRLTKLLNVVDPINSVLNDQTQAQKQVAEATGSTSVKATELAQTETQLKDAAKAAAEAHDNLFKAVEQFGQAALDARGAARDYQAALDSATESVKKNGRTLDTNTEKGRANQVALESIRTTALKSITANAEHGASLKSLDKQVDGARAKFITFATQMGMSRSAAGALASQLGLTRGNVNQLASEIRKTPTSHNTKMTVETAAAAARVTSLQRSINALRGNSVTITTRYVETGKSSGGGQNRQGGITKADGGAIYGPGTGTSDSIDAKLSNGEHVWTAEEVQMAGGQGAMYRARSMVKAGVMKFRDGGAVGAPKFADGGQVDFNDIYAILDNVTTYDDVKTSRATRSSKAASVTSAKNALASLIAQQRKAARDLIAARRALATAKTAKQRAAASSSINTILDRQHVLLGKVAAAEGKVTTARNASTAAVKATKAVEAEYARDRRPIITRATEAAKSVNRTSKTFLDNIDKLTKMGFKTLALELLTQGGSESEALAAQAVKSASKARSLQSAFAASAGLSAREAAMKAKLEGTGNTGTVSAVGSLSGLLIRQGDGTNLNVNVSADPGLAREYAGYVAKKTTTALKDTVALYGLTNLKLG